MAWLSLLWPHSSCGYLQKIKLFKIFSIGDKTPAADYQHSFSTRPLCSQPPLLSSSHLDPTPATRATGSPAPAQPTPNRLTHSHHHIPAPNSVGRCRLSQRLCQPPKLQPPTHWETLSLPEATPNLGGPAQPQVTTSEDQRGKRSQETKHSSTKDKHGNLRLDDSVSTSQGTMAPPESDTLLQQTLNVITQLKCKRMTWDSTLWRK